jgi:hypothetical protein
LSVPGSGRAWESAYANRTSLLAFLRGPALYSARMTLMKTQIAANILAIVFGVASAIAGSLLLLS